MISSRRSFITGLASLIAAPAIVRVASLMPVRGIVLDTSPEDIYALLNKRMDECYAIMRQNMTNCLYGGRLSWVENDNKFHFTEILPEQVYSHLEISMPIKFGAVR